MKTLLTTALICAATLLNAQSIPFTFHNSSAKSIPLMIPGVMNPNLSPFSDSGVNLEVGQKVFFKLKGRKTLLFEVSEEMRGDGTRQRIDIADEIRDRKKALDQKKG